MLLIAQASTEPTLTSFTGPIISLGGFGLLLILLLTGRVVTKSSYDEMKSDRDAYKASSELANKSLSESVTALKELSDKGEVTNRVLSEIKANTEKQGR